MSRSGDTFRIPLRTEEAIARLLRVKPTAGMPRPGKHRSKPALAAADEEYGPMRSGRKAAQPKLGP